MAGMPMVPLGYQSGVYDTPLMGILQNCVKLPNFLDAVFSFLARKTDFYVIMEHDKAKMGFPLGVAENMVAQAFKKYEILTRKRETEMMHEKEMKSLETLDEGESTAEEPVEEPEIHIQDELPITLPPSLVTPSDSESSNADKNQANERKDAPVLSKEKVEDWEKISDVYNGAEMENYKWSQTITDIDVRVFLPAGTMARDLKVDILSDRLKVELRKPTITKILINKPLLHKIKVEDSMWTVDKDRNLLTINLEKTKEIMWKSVLEGEEAIDLSKVDTTRDISEFDPECQAAIQKVSYDQHMKRLGKPTSNEEEISKMLELAAGAVEELSKDSPSSEVVDYKTKDFVKTLEGIEKGLSDEIQYLSQVSTSQAHEGSVYAAEKDYELSVLQTMLAKKRLQRYREPAGTSSTSMAGVVRENSHSGEMYSS